MRPCMSMQCVRNCSGGGLFPSPQRWQQECFNFTNYDVLMVPKTGSEFLHFNMKKACPYTPRANTRFHTQLYSPCSVASLRDPCERLHSIFAHLKNKYPNKSMGVEWIDNAHSVDEFAVAVRDHWSEVRNHNTRDARSKRRDLILLQPQYLWIGDLSYIVCQNRLFADILRFATEIQCKNTNSISNATILPRILKDHKTNRLVKFANSSAQYDAVAEFGRLSRHACLWTKYVYREDELLFSTHCRD